MEDVIRLVALIAAVPLAACSFHGDSGDSRPGVVGSGTGTTRSFAVTDFTGVELRGADNVDVRVGTGFSVRAEGPTKQLDALRIEKVGGTLRIGRIDDNSFSWGGNHKGVTVYVTMPRIVDASITGSGDMAIDRVEGQTFKGDSAGSGGLDVAALNVQSADLAITGSGDINLKGTARRISGDITGSGNINASGLTAEGAKVSIAGSGGVKANVTGPAQISIVGSGDVDLGAGAKCSTSKTGSGDVRCGG